MKRRTHVSATCLESKYCGSDIIPEGNNIEEDTGERRKQQKQKGRRRGVKRMARAANQKEGHKRPYKNNTESSISLKEGRSKVPGSGAIPHIIEKREQGAIHRLHGQAKNVARRAKRTARTPRPQQRHKTTPIAPKKKDTALWEGEYQDRLVHNVVKRETNNTPPCPKTRRRMEEDKRYS